MEHLLNGKFILFGVEGSGEISVIHTSKNLKKLVDIQKYMEVFTISERCEELEEVINRLPQSVKIKLYEKDFEEFSILYCTNDAKMISKMITSKII